MVLHPFITNRLTVSKWIKGDMQFYVEIYYLSILLTLTLQGLPTLARNAAPSAFKGTMSTVCEGIKKPFNSSREKLAKKKNSHFKVGKNTKYNKGMGRNEGKVREGKSEVEKERMGQKKGRKEDKGGREMIQRTRKGEVEKGEEVKEPEEGER